MISRLDNFLAVGLLVTLCFAALAHGAVEAWSVVSVIAALAVLALVWGAKAILERQFSLVVPDSFWPLFGILLLGAVQSLRWTSGIGAVQGLSQDFESSRIGITIGFALLVFFLLAANFITSRERLRGLAGFLTVYGFAMAVFALLQHFTWNGKFYWLRKPLSDLSTPYGPFANHNHFAGYMEMLVMIPAALIAAGGVRREKRILYSFMAAIMGITIFFSLSRGGIVSLVCGLLFIVLLAGRLPAVSHRSRRRNASWRGAAAVAIITVVIGGGIFWIGADPVIGRLGGDSQDTLATSRVWIWKDSLRIFLDHPIVGAGLGSLQTVYPHRSQYDGSQGYVAQAHNDYLQILAEGGIIGGILVLWFIWVVLRDIFRGIRVRDPLMAGLALGAGAGMVSLLVHSMVDFNLQLPSNVMLFLLLASIASFCSRNMVTRNAEVEIPAGNQNAPHLRVGV